ncbi:Dihydrolipoyl dehydrogenase [Trichinella spiralis]|uniref:Dihydrolipoyl dehydrogenase n=1 Tax=Trichinella spiralis TaxID=6334 RepID=A0ABR3L458_TRISP
MIDQQQQQQNEQNDLLQLWCNKVGCHWSVATGTADISLSNGAVTTLSVVCVVGALCVKKHTFARVQKRVEESESTASAGIIYAHSCADWNRLAWTNNRFNHKQLCDLTNERTPTSLHIASRLLIFWQVTVLSDDCNNNAGRPLID